MLHLRARSMLGLVLVCLFAGPLLAAETAAPTASASSVLAEYRERLEHVRQEIPHITAAAEAVAQRWVEREKVLIQLPMLGDSLNFASELTFRAGGIDNVSLPYAPDRITSANDVIVYGPRSWETGIAYLATELPANREAGMLTIVFASKAGAPDLPMDFLIDNGAAGGGEDEAAMNQIVNVTNGWLWSCELASALTRLGRRPGVLKGMTLPGSTAHNQEYQAKHGVLYPWDKPIAAGELAEAYLRGIEEVLEDLESEPQQEAIERAADLAAERLRAGKSVWASSFTHVLNGEVVLNNASPMKGIASSIVEHGERILETVGEGDLLFWFGEWTLNAPYRDYLALIRQTGADYIPSYRPIAEPMEPMEGDTIFYDQEIDDALMVLEQHWPYENAVVEIPFPPGKMAPVSGVYVLLQFRMLDEAIASRTTAEAVEAAETAEPALR